MNKKLKIIRKAKEELRGKELNSRPIEDAIPLASILKLRKELHKWPELSNNEKETAQKVKNFLSKYKPTKILQNLGGHGLACIYEFDIKGPTILVRCELDALPIQEVNQFRHRSSVKRVSHKCGHDGHMSILAGLATLLHKIKFNSGRVVLLFQPAEENGEGAKKVLVDKRFLQLKPDYVFALHNLPGVNQGEILCKEGSFTAAVRSIIISLKGKTAHAGEPEKGHNPALAIAIILQRAVALIKPSTHKDFALVTPIQIEMGEEAYGISAGEGVVKLTLRAWDDKTLDKLAKKVEAICRQAARKYKLDLKIDWTQFFASNQNNPIATTLIKDAAIQNELKYTDKKEPFKWGEDFGLFTSKYRGAMFGLGAGKRTPALHNPDYDFPDDITIDGIKMFYQIIYKILNPA